MAEVNSFGAIKVLMMVTFSKTISMVSVITIGVLARDMKAAGPGAPFL